MIEEMKKKPQKTKKTKKQNKQKNLKNIELISRFKYAERLSSPQRHGLFSLFMAVFRLA